MTTLYEEVRATLRESEFRPRKRLGQNFLVHENIIEAILRLLEVSHGDEIVEIGPELVLADIFDRPGADQRLRPRDALGDQRARSRVPEVRRVRAL